MLRCYHHRRVTQTLHFVICFQNCNNLGFLSFWFFQHCQPLSSFKLQTLSPAICKGTGGGHNGGTCVVAALCVQQLSPFSLHPPIQRSIYMKCQSPWGIIWELIICGEWFCPINYGSHVRKRMGLMCHMGFFGLWTRNSLASNINNGFVEYRLMTSDRNYRRNLYHFVLL